MFPNLSKLEILPAQCRPCRAPAPATAVALQGEHWASLNCFCGYPLNKDSPVNPWIGTNQSIAPVCVNAHVYHKGCIRKWRDQQGKHSCPECRQPLIDALIDNGAPLRNDPIVPPGVPFPGVLPPLPVINNEDVEPPLPAPVLPASGNPPPLLAPVDSDDASDERRLRQRTESHFLD